MNVRINPELVRLKALLGDWAARFDADLLETCPSTNSLLLERAAAGAPSGTVLWTYNQTAGRGRRGRVWHSAPGTSLTFSLVWRFAPGAELAGLGLAVGLAVAQALEDLGVGDVGLKWPNDIWLDGRKLGGVLVEMAQAGGRSAAVIGIGINVKPLPQPVLDQATAALSERLDPVPDTVAILARILVSLGGVLGRFDARGFAPLREAWMARHVAAGRPVRVQDERGCLEGRCLGVDEAGALLIERNGAVLRCLGGDLSLRALEI